MTRERDYHSTDARGQKSSVHWVGYFLETSTDGVGDDSFCPLMFVLQPVGELDIGQKLFTLYT